MSSGGSSTFLRLRVATHCRNSLWSCIVDGGRFYWLQLNIRLPYFQNRCFMCLHLRRDRDSITGDSNGPTRVIFHQPCSGEEAITYGYLWENDEQRSWSRIVAAIFPLPHSVDFAEKSVPGQSSNPQDVPNSSRFILSALLRINCNRFGAFVQQYNFSFVEIRIADGIHALQF